MRQCLNGGDWLRLAQVAELRMCAWYFRIRSPGAQPATARVGVEESAADSAARTPVSLPTWRKPA